MRNLFCLTPELKRSHQLLTNCLFLWTHTVATTSFAPNLLVEVTGCPLQACHILLLLHLDVGVPVHVLNILDTEPFKKIIFAPWWTEHNWCWKKGAEGSQLQEGFRGRKLRSQGGWTLSHKKRIAWESVCPGVSEQPNVIRCQRNLLSWLK